MLVVACWVSVLFSMMGCWYI